MTTTELPQRFWDKVQFSEDGCWLWTAAKTSGGYGSFRWGKETCAHRVSYSVLVGPIPDGLTIDHLCRVRPCVNPDHLEPITHLENVRRGKIATATYCKRGHPYNEENTYWATNKQGGVSRVCRACNREWERKRKAKLKETTRKVVS